MKVVYVAGAFSAPTEEEREANTTSAMMAALPLIELGITTIVPHLCWGQYYGLIDEHRAMAMCKEMVSRADALYVFDKEHLTTSKGTRDEVEEALKCRIPVFVERAKLDAWIEGA